MKTLKNLLDVAIQQEINSQKLYRFGMTLVDDKESKQLLNRLVEEEVQHENILYNIKQTGIYDLDTPINDESIFDSTAVSHGDDSAEIDQNLTIEQVFEIALKREYRAQQVFATAAKSVDDKELVTLFTNLADEEEDHHRVVERHYNLLQGLMGKEI